MVCIRTFWQPLTIWRLCQYCKPISCMSRISIHAAGWSVLELQGESAGCGSPSFPCPELFSKLCLYKQQRRLLFSFTLLFSPNCSKGLRVKMRNPYFLLSSLSSLSTFFRGRPHLWTAGESGKPASCLHSGLNPGEPLRSYLTPTFIPSFNVIDSSNNNKNKKVPYPSPESFLSPYNTDIS